jgi:putative ABC transport system ATP-binding protein
MQRVAIGRALALSPLIILADEPTANLDSHTSENVLKMMKEINETRGTTFLFATHDPLVLKYVNRVIKIHDGELV